MGDFYWFIFTFTQVRPLGIFFTTLAHYHTSDDDIDVSDFQTPSEWLLSHMRGIVIKQEATPFS